MGRMLNWFKTWRERRGLKQLVRTMGSRLRQRYGAQEFYTPGQVLKTCESIGLDENAQDQAIAMYVQPELADGILSKLNKSKGAHALRKFLIARCFDNFSEGCDADYNPFVHPSSHEGFDSFGDGSTSSDSGHGGGDSGGGHH